MAIATESGSAALESSFRDPGGAVFQWEGKVFRAVNAAGEADLSAFLGSASGVDAMRRGRIAETRLLAADEAGALLANPEIRSIFDGVAGRVLLEHERIRFPSFPYEWIPEMLHAAAELTLDLMESLLRDGLGLKDATPYNVLFRGTEPVFIDLLSFERRDPGNAMWLPYAQFVRTFLLPLLAAKHFGFDLNQILLARRDGLEPEQVYRWAGALQRWRGPFLSLVSLPTWLGGGQKR